MAQLLHTADIHLVPDNQDRIEALRSVLNLAEKDGIEIVTIGGDLSLGAS